MKMPMFTPDQVIQVFATRWMVRDTANSFLKYLRYTPIPYADSPPQFRRTVCFGTPASIRAARGEGKADG